MGRARAQALLARGEAVRAVVRRPGSAPPGAVEVLADICDADAVARALDGATRVFHCAGCVSVASGLTCAARRQRARRLPRGSRRRPRLGGARLQRPRLRPRRAGAFFHRGRPAPGLRRRAVRREQAPGRAGDAACRHREPHRRARPQRTPGPTAIGAVLADLRAGRLPALVDGGFDQHVR
ncbi:MAG: hypothetical protein R3F59_06155 [Myxococcota bacterium]